MKLICEITEEIKILKEGKAGPQNYFIEGIFMQAELKNRNGRMYPKQVLANEIDRYIKEYVEKRRAFGELGHPDDPTINLDRVSHMIVSLKESGNDYIGRAKILDTPHGNIVKSLINEGAQLGVSSRGMGSLKPTTSADGDVEVVQDDFYLATAADIVADPSAPNAFVRGIMEGREWVWKNGVLKEKHIASYKKQIQSATKKNLKEISVKVFKNFIDKLENS